jgi:hypothetical protein
MVSVVPGWLQRSIEIGKEGGGGFGADQGCWNKGVIHGVVAIGWCHMAAMRSMPSKWKKVSDKWVRHGSGSRRKNDWGGHGEIKFWDLI